MLSDEEKEAIEYIKNCLDNEYNFKNATRQKDKKAYNIILNLIEKQDKIINEMAEFIEDEMTVDEFCKEKNCYADEYINGHCQKCLKCIIKFYSKKVGE